MKINKKDRKMKKAQYFSYEAILGALLFGLLTFNIVASQNQVSNNYLEINSFFNSLTKNNQFRLLVETENLSNKSLTNNWNNILTLIKGHFNNFKLIVSNLTTTKIIQNFTENCNNIVYTEKIINIYNNTIQNFRIVKFGVCS